MTIAAGVSMADFQRFQSRFGLSLNPQQQAAVESVEGPVLLLAVPGSGKTTVLTVSYTHLTKYGQHDDQLHQRKAALILQFFPHSFRTLSCYMHTIPE